MKRLYFKSERHFLQELDGKVYAVSDKNGRYLCDVIEEDYLKLLDVGILVDYDISIDEKNMDMDSNVTLTIDMGEKGCSEFKDKFGLLIDIEGKEKNDCLKNFSIDYELDSLILKSSKDEQETAFVFMDGVAIQIKSLDVCIPVTNPVILTYPHKSEVFNNVRMRKDIERYCGYSWDGDYYSIALLYGKENRLQKINN